VWEWPFPTAKSSDKSVWLATSPIPCSPKGMDLSTFHIVPTSTCAVCSLSLHLKVFVFKTNYATYYDEAGRCLRTFWVRNNTHRNASWASTLDTILRTFLPFNCQTHLADKPRTKWLLVYNSLLLRSQEGGLLRPHLSAWLSDLSFSALNLTRNYDPSVILNPSRKVVTSLLLIGQTQRVWWGYVGLPSLHVLRHAIWQKHQSFQLS